MHDTAALNLVRHLVVNMRKEPYDFYIGRNGRGVSACFGNIFPIIPGNPNATRAAVVSKSETLMLEGTTQQAKDMRANLHLLKGKKVGCFCSPNLCHGHPIAHHANSLEPGEVLPLGGKIPRLTERWVDVDPSAQAIKTPAVAPLSSVTDLFVGFSRYPHPGKSSYEMSSHGDKRFSALWAVMPDGRTLEQHYQCDVKAYDPGGTNWRLGKGKPPLKDVDLWASYKSLWSTWVDCNPAVFQDLAAKAKNCILTDKFASSPISQARALAELLSERMGWRLDSGARAAPVKSAASAVESKNSAPEALLVKSIEKPAPLLQQVDLFGDPVPAPSSRSRMRP